MIRALLGALALASCGQSYTTTTLRNPATSATADDPAPPEVAEDPALAFEGRYGSENRSAMRYRFDVASFANDEERADSARLYPSHAAHLRAHPGGIASVQTIVTYGKQLDDTIVAGVELAMQTGAVDGPALRAFLDGTIAYLTAHRGAGDDALIVLSAAAGVPAPADLAARRDAFERDFEGDAARSKPIGFYTWSDDLRAVWRRGRLLQTRLEAPAACAVARAIAADPARAAGYRSLVELQARITNPQHATLVDRLAMTAPQCEAAGAAAILGASRTTEGDLYDRLYPTGAPANADLMRDLVRAIREGTVQLAPRPGDGWYQYQQYALETLLVTDRAEERAKIAFTARYKQRLVEAFSTMMTQHRETHIMHAGSKGAMAAAAPVVPQFRVEPLATVFVRHARSYVFLEQALEQVLGAAALDRVAAVGERGVEPDTLRARIRRARDVFFGAYLVACQDIGLHPKLDAAGDPAAADQPALLAAARDWLAGLANDPVAAADVRVAVPVAAVDREHTKYWVVIGVRTTVAGYSYIAGADASLPPEGTRQARVPLPTEQFLEVVSSSTPPTRAELRELCDRYQTRDAIKAALEARR